MNDLNFYQGTTDLLKDIKKEADGDIQELQLQEIKSRLVEFFNIKNIHFLFGSGTSCNAIPNMKGLFKEVLNTLIALRDNDPENILYRNYLNRYEEKKDDFQICSEQIKIIEEVIFNKINISFAGVEAQKVLANYQAFYQKLALRNKDLSRLNIFTTNNDLFNEIALDSLNIHYINGFGGGINKFFNPALFNYTYSKRMDTLTKSFNYR